MVVQSQFIEMFGNPVTNPMGWSTKPLCQVAPESPSNTKMKGRVWVLNLDMIESNSGFIINKVFEDSDDLNSVAAFDEGNVLFSKLRPYLNKVTIPDGKGYATTELVPLRPHTDELRQHFLSFLLRTDEFVKYADGIATGTKMPRMPMTALREFKCILPPTELQDLFCGISKQADKSKFDGLKSQFIEMFSCTLQRKLSDVAHITMGTSPDSKYYNTTNTGLPFYQGKTEFGDMYIGEAPLYCSEPIRIAQPNDILMSVRAPVGAVNITKEECCIGRGLASIRPNGVEQLFLYYALKLKEKDLDALGTGTTFKAINKDTLYEFSIEVGTIDKQIAFVEIAQQADKSKYLS